MFDIGWPELLVIAIVLIVVVGPKDLPKMLRSFGKTTGQMRKMAGEFRKQFDEALREAELDEVRDLAKSVRKLDPLGDVKKELNPLRKVGDEIKADLTRATTAEKPKADEPAPKPAEPAPAATAKAASPVKTGKTKPASAKGKDA